MLQNVKEGAAFHRFVQRSPIGYALDSMVRKKLHRVVPEAGYQVLYLSGDRVINPQLILPSRLLALSLPLPNSHAQLKRTSISSPLPSCRAPAPPTEPPSARFVSSFRNSTRSLETETCWYWPTLKLGESLMHHTHGTSSFAKGRSHPFDTSSPDIA